MKIKKKSEWYKIFEDELDEDYSDVMGDFIEENPTEEVLMITDTLKVLDKAVAWMEQFKETLKQAGQDVSKLDEYDVIDISGALQLRLEQLVEESLED